MKTELIIANETRFVANKCLDECKLTERYLLKLFHELLLCPKDCTENMVTNIAIKLGKTVANNILMDENFSDTYLKYAN